MSLDEKKDLTVTTRAVIELETKEKHNKSDRNDKKHLEICISDCTSIHLGSRNIHVSV